MVCLLTVKSCAVNAAPLEDVDGGGGSDIAADAGTPQYEDTDDDFENWPALTEDDSSYETQVTGYRLHTTDEVTGFAETVVVVEERKRLVSLAEVLSQTMGVQVRTMGGLGTYGAATIRGSTPNQVPVFIDGIQLNIGGFSVVNIGDFSLDILDSIEVYRGNTPLELGTGGIGGAIVLKTKSLKAPFNEFIASYGSWNTWRLATLYGARLGEMETLAVVSGQHSDGDFNYYNSNGTPNNPDDDEFTRRANNDHSSLSALLKLSREFGSWKLAILDDFFYKKNGLPGLDHTIGSDIDVDARLTTLRNTANLRLERPINERIGFHLDLAYLFIGEQYDDLSGTIGTGHQDNRYETNGVLGAAFLSAAFTPEQITKFRLACRYEHYDEKRINLSDEEQQKPSHRVRTELGIEHEWIPHPSLHVVPTLRGELHYSYFGGGPSPDLLTDFEETSLTDFYFSPSLGIRYQVVEGLTLRTNGGRYTRSPEVTELFGDRGSVIGNPELKAEVGYNVDAGATYVIVGKAKLDFLRMDAAWFASFVEDLISLEQNSQSTSQPVNIDAAEIQGVELGITIALFDLVNLNGNYTYFHGVNTSDVQAYKGKELPGRPPHEAYGRLEVGRTLPDWGLAGWMDADYAGKSYVGRYNNEDQVTKHFFVGLGSRLELPRIGLTFTFEVKNLLDTTVFKNDEGDWLAMCDYGRYPLPGRTYIGTIHWRRP
jgi:iron complex outermembrane receptor protein